MVLLLHNRSLIGTASAIRNLLDIEKDPKKITLLKFARRKLFSSG
jgi:hypothetical protein